MEIASSTPDRPYTHLTDLELAEKLTQMEAVLEQDAEGDNQEPILMIRHSIIEEIIFRYTNQKS